MNGPAAGSGALPQDGRPPFGPADAQAVAGHFYRLDVEASELPSYKDRNFLLREGSRPRAVLKFIEPSPEEEALLGLEAQVLHELHRSWPDGRAPFPSVLATHSGHTLARPTGADGREYLARAVEYIPGTPLAEIGWRPDALYRHLGRILGETDRILAGIPGNPGNRPLEWDLRRAEEIVRTHGHRVVDPGRQELLWATLQQVTDALDSVGGPGPRTLRERLPLALIHNDANDYNVLVDWTEPPGHPGAEPRVSGLIDFGDMIRTWRIAELAVAGAYLVLDRPDPLAVVDALASAYHQASPLEEAELEALLPLVRLRLAQSVAMSARQSAAGSGDPYHTVSEDPAWRTLERLAQIPHELAEAHVRHACGMDPAPGGARLAAWLASHRERGFPSVLEGMDDGHLATMDLSVGSTLLADIPQDAGARTWTDVLFRYLEREGAGVGVGGYDEPRRWYTSPLFREDGNEGPCWRTVHLGVDLFAPAGTPVRSPLPGRVVSVRLNDGPLDYGPTVILEHELVDDDGPFTFFALFGHLEWASVADLAPGTVLQAGEAFAALGGTQENGGWAPHLHYQLFTHTLGYEGDFPGVAVPRARDVWKGFSPDPSPLLGLDPGGTAPAHRSAPVRRHPSLPPAPTLPKDDILAYRRRHLGPNLSVSYRRPLKIVRGWMQHLFDQDGQAYLDAVNNVPHVGHCHPVVVEAARSQMAVLNTNTRYLHDELEAYARELLVTFPEPLRVLYLVNSGSEANELALRLARTHTGRPDTLVLEAGYHGHTTLLVEASSYKFSGPGGRGPGDWVHVAPLPDPYRGIHRLGPGKAADPGALEAVAEAYARDAVRVMDAAAEAGSPVGAFLAESLPGCGGQIVLPPGYLARTYAALRERGGVCIADEVQIGFGRVGTHMWGFQTQGVVPDIVTLGKPMGNGHPLGAVVTTPEIAASFDTGMEFFSTFGGNPVSCAVGRAVLHVLRSEGLQERALHVGAHLKRALEEVAREQPLIGEVRGLGLYLGVELVLDPETREPAPGHATRVANRMRDRGILISTDGPDHNVLKIKPPMPFDEADADRLAATLDSVLRELPGAM